MWLIPHAVFWISFGLVVYVYAGFPVCLLLLTWRRRTSPPPIPSDDALPSISFVVAAYNEELVIEEKLLNCLRLDYPEEKLTFIFVSESTDGTNDILLRYRSPRIQVRIMPERGGKVASQAAAYPLCEGDILVFSDANTYYRSNCIKMLARHFADPQIGVVTGDVRLLPSEQKFGQGESLYYKYERRLQELESTFWSTVAIDGAMYAMRRECFRPVSSGLIADDFVPAIKIALQGYRIIYDPEAIAEEDPTPGDAQEFWRKVRVVAYAIQSFLAGEGVPPLRQTRLWWLYVSHKLLRWFVPFDLIFMFLASGVAAFGSPWWAGMLAAQVAFYALAVYAWRTPNRAALPFRVPYYFCMVNLAALRGIVRGIRKQQRPVWTRTERSLPPRA
jgi:cellulose synthase/poly-beta-1,6-N-acetylglucosamine synthase-like glycosyltransferase